MPFQASHDPGGLLAVALKDGQEGVRCCPFSKSTKRSSPLADDFLYGAKAIAEYMGLYHRTVSRWIRERGLPATFQGRGYITTKEAIDG